VVAEQKVQHQDHHLEDVAQDDLKDFGRMPGAVTKTRLGDATFPPFARVRTYPQHDGPVSSGELSYGPDRSVKEQPPRRSGHEGKRGGRRLSHDFQLGLPIEGGWVVFLRRFVG
jgi:hypothetical protein